ncbi:MAG: SDR family oxidoreductase [Alphaproteobacteria bacterium]|nr:SDR family oxidoreductase [Alphaproteobacteria bacterium]
MIRRDVLKSLGLAAAGTASGVTLTKAEAQELNDALNLALENFGLPWAEPDPEVPGRMNIARVPDDYFMPGRFAGKNVLVTGSARGMGADAARRLAREGANVVGVDILGDLGEETAESIRSEGLNMVFMQGDISQDSVCEEMVRLCVSEYGSLDAAINNAGVMDALHPDEPIDYVNQKNRLMAKIHEAGDEYWLRVMEVNATGTFYSLRHELRQMLAQGKGGSIVNIASVTGIRGFGGTPPYTASKHAVQALTKNAAIDYAPYGIRVNSTGMGTTLTPMYERAVEIITQRRATGYKDSGISLAKSRSLLELSDENDRGSTSAEQVAIMLFLLSPEASNITGATYNTDGGFTIY